MPPLSDDIAWWYCCLDVAERTVMRQTCEGLALTLYLGVPVAVWDVFWIATTHDTDAYKEAFLGLYHLEIATIEVDEVPTAVVRPRDGFLPLWVYWTVQLATPLGACLDGCQQTQLPTPS